MNGSSPAVGVTTTANTNGDYAIYAISDLYVPYDRIDMTHIVVNSDVTKPVINNIVQRCKYCDTKFEQHEKRCCACGAPL